MLRKHKRLRALVAAAGLLVSMFAVQAIPAAAQARCVWILAPQTGTLNHLGTNYVTETPVTNTCQNNSYYSSDFRSNVAGWRASVWIQNDGAWTGHYGGRNLASVHMEYYDANSHSLMVLCADDGTWWICGYGTNTTASTGGPNFSINVLNAGF